MSAGCATQLCGSNTSGADSTMNGHEPLDMNDGKEIKNPWPDNTIVAESTSKPLRTIICMDANEWLRTVSDIPAVMTSLPDLTESRELQQWGGVNGYKEWFLSTVKSILRKLRPGAAAVFYQTDCMLVDSGGEVQHYVDKSFLCSLAAQEVGARMLWHKIALRNQASTAMPLSVSLSTGSNFPSPPLAVPHAPDAPGRLRSPRFAQCTQSNLRHGIAVKSPK